MFKTKNILTEQMRINPLTPEGSWHTNLNMFHTRADKELLQFQLDMLKDK